MSGRGSLKVAGVISTWGWLKPGHALEPHTSLTPNEAGYVAEQSSTAINRAVHRSVIKAKLSRRPGVAVAVHQFIAV